VENDSFSLLILGRGLGGVNFALIWQNDDQLALPALPDHAHGGAAGARIVLDVAVEAGLSTSDPVAGVVVIGPGACRQKAEKDVAGRPDDNSRVSRPHDHIAGLRLRDAAESFHACVEIIRTRIDVREARALVDIVNKVRTVVGGIAPHFGVERNSDHVLSVIASQSFSGVVLGCLR
jgi:hypothetical protein